MLYKFPVEWYCVWIVIIIIARLLPRLIEVGDATIDIGERMTACNGCAVNALSTNNNFPRSRVLDIR